MAWLSATVASSHRHPLHLPPPHSCSSSIDLCAVRVCPSHATASGCSTGVFSFSAFPSPPPFITGAPWGRRRRTGAAATSGWFREESGPCPSSSYLRLLPAAPRSPSCRLSREQERNGSLGRKRTAGSVSCGGAGGGALVEVKQVEHEEENKDDASILALEAEIYDFMQNSGKPTDFPTKDELIAAGRMDLVEAIVAHGGWLAYGWDFDDDEVSSAADVDGDEEEEKEEQVCDGERRADVADFPIHERNSTTINHSEPTAGWMDKGILQHQMFSTVDSASSSSTGPSSGRPIEPVVAEENGIEGILSRLEKERSFSFTVGSKGKDADNRVSSKNKDYDFGSSVGSITRGSRSILLDSNKHFCPDFERADEKFPSGNVNEAENFLNDVPVDDCAFPIDQIASDMRNGRKEPSSAADTDKNQIHSRLQYLESELAFMLNSLRSRTDAILLQKGQESSLKELHRLSDAWEFQENEIMKARDKLRSTRAKLSVLEGKMALEIIEAQKIVEEKQKRIDAAQRAVCLLRSAYVVWPNSASEVLLAGSFDGWSSQRRMERSSTGIFSLCLRLYPGQYEMKFIVDGVWKIDPLRPIVYNNGFENNLLIVSSEHI